METWMRDLRMGARALRGDPKFTVLAVLVMALGIGGNAAIFSLVKKVLVDSLPFDQGDRLVMVWDEYNPPGADSAQRALVSAVSHNARKTAIASQTGSSTSQTGSSLTGLGALHFTDLLLTGGTEPESFSTVRVSHDVLPLLGTRVILGRALTADDDQSASPARVVLISHELWKRRYGGDKNVLGTTLLLDHESHTLVGVVAPRSQTPYGVPDLWIPLGLDNIDASDAQHQQHLLITVGRLAPGKTTADVSSELAVVSRRLEQEYPESHAGWGADVISFRDYLTGDLKSRLLALQIASFFVLLIVCSNMANLILVRSERLRHELAVRAALGATRGGQARRLLIENILLASLGGLAGITLAFFVLRHPLSLGLLTHLLTSDRTSPDIFSTSVDVDGGVLGFSLGITLLTGLAFGLAPVIAAYRSHPFALIKQRSSDGVTSDRLFHTLAIAEIALAMILLVGAALMLKSFANLGRVPLGFDTSEGLVIDLNLPDSTYAEPRRRINFVDQVLERVQAVPGVTSTGFTSTMPLRNQGIFARFNIRGRAPASESELLFARYALIAPGSLKTLGIPLVRGRFLEPSDDEGTTGAVVLSRSMAELYWGAGNPVGKQIQRHGRPTPDKPWLTVVGVVDDAVYGDITVGAEPIYYLPYRQHAASRRALTMHLIARTKTGSDEVTAAVRTAVRAAIHEIDPVLPISLVGTFEQLRVQAYSDHRSSTLLTGLLSCIAVILGLLGIYGVISYFVGRRTREIGIRMSLGANAADILTQVLRRGLLLTLIGLLLGGLGGIFLTRLLAVQLYEVDPLDPLSFLIAALSLAVVSLLASYLPAKKASKTDPIVALRYE